MDYEIALAGLVVGTLIGWWLAQRVRAEQLSALLAASLLVIGVVLVGISLL